MKSTINNSQCFLQLCVALTVACIIGCVQGNLKATQCKSRLPAAASLVTAVYDNEDSIYLFGGRSGEKETQSQKSLLKYSITKDAVEEIGTLESWVYGGFTITSKTGQVFHIGGVDEVIFHHNTSNVILFTPNIKSFGEFGFFRRPFYKYDSAIVQVDHNLVYAFGGSDDPGGIWRLDYAEFEMFKVGTLKKKCSERMSAIQAVHKGEVVVYLFGCGGDDKSNKCKIVEYNPEKDKAKLADIKTDLPCKAGEAVWTGKDVLLVGNDDSGKTGFYFLNLATKAYDYSFKKVSSLPENLDESSAVYIPKLKRVYLFGGKAGAEGEAGQYQDSIWFVDIKKEAGADSKSEL